MFEKIIIFNTMFSRFFVALASQNGPQIQIFSSFSENLDLVKILTKQWLCAEKSRFGLEKITKNSIRQRALRKSRERLPKNRFELPFGPPNTSPKPSKIDAGREGMES